MAFISTQNIKGDIFGGITAGIVALPLALAFGIQAFGGFGRSRPIGFLRLTVWRHALANQRTYRSHDGHHCGVD